MTEKTPRTDPKGIRSLRAAGCPLPVSEPPLPPDLVIQSSCLVPTQAYEFRGGTEFIFSLQIKNVSYSRLEMQRFKCRLPWKDRQFLWQVDPRRFVSDSDAYRLPSARKFPYTTVLNHRTGELGCIEPGGMLEGVMLGLSLGRSIPEPYPHGSAFFARISVLDEYGRWHASFIEVPVDKSATMRPPRPARATSLFESPEVGGRLPQPDSDQGTPQLPGSRR
jgi:hypothetical protein